MICFQEEVIQDDTPSVSPQTSLSTFSISVSPCESFEAIEPSASFIISKPILIKKERNDELVSEIMNLVEEKLKTYQSEDPFCVYGKHVANKLRCLDNEQRIYAEKLINDVIFVAELEELSNDSRIVNCEDQTKSSISGPFAVTALSNTGTHTIYANSHVPPGFMKYFTDLREI